MNKRYWNMILNGIMYGVLLAHYATEKDGWIVTLIIAIILTHLRLTYIEGMTED